MARSSCNWCAGPSPGVERRERGIEGDGVIKAGGLRYLHECRHGVGC
jgi:hypothetical protein